MKETPWIVLDANPQPAEMHCTRCNERRAIDIPVAVEVLVKRMKAFGHLHEDCASAPDATETST